MRWIEALKIYNASKGGAWCVPRKGTADHEAVMKILRGDTKLKPTPAKVADKLGKSMETKKKERVAKFLLALAKRRKEKKKEAKESPKKSKLPDAEYAVDSILRNMMEEYLVEEGYEEEEAEEKIQNDYVEVLMDMGGGYGVYDDIVEEIYLRMVKRGYSKKEILEGMDAMREEGNTMFEDFVEEIRSKKRKEPKK
jgi:hypothetical protein